MWPAHLPRPYLPPLCPLLLHPDHRGRFAALWPPPHLGPLHMPFPVSGCFSPRTCCLSLTTTASVGLGSNVTAHRLSLAILLKINTFHLARVRTHTNTHTVLICFPVTHTHTHMHTHSPDPLSHCLHTHTHTHTHTHKHTSHGTHWYSVFTSCHPPTCRYIYLPERQASLSLMFPAAFSKVRTQTATFETLSTHVASINKMTNEMP